MQVEARLDLLSKVGPEFYGLSDEDAERFQANIDLSNDAADDGTIYHEVFEECINERISEYRDILAAIHGRTDLSSAASGDEFIHDKLIKCIQEQLEFLSTVDFFEIEKKVIVKGLPQFGHTDLVATVGRTMHMRDLKTGRIDVEAVDNDQLKVYSVGILDELGWDNFDEVITQPLGLHWEAEPWTVSVDDLKTYKHDVMLPAFLDAYSINPTASAGDHCLYCPAKIHCKEWQEKFDGLDNEYFENNDIKECESDELVAMFKLTKQADNLKKMLSAELLQRAESFDPPEGVKPVKGRKIQKWIDEDAAAKKLGADKFYKKQARSPSDFTEATVTDLVKTTYARGYLK